MYSNRSVWLLVFRVNGLLQKPGHMVLATLDDKPSTGTSKIKKVTLEWLKPLVLEAVSFFSNSVTGKIGGGLETTTSFRQARDRNI